MGAGRKTKTLTLKEKTDSTWTVNSSASARNLTKADLGAVIFGCKHYTYKECLSNQLFGLPAPHFAYVKNIRVGLPLFLFNYSDRTLHGIFEAASPGQLNINPNGWTSDGTESTPYPAQVRVRVRKLCHPLPENQFASIIGKNYYEERLFWFELDQTQSKRLIDLFSSSPASDVAPSMQSASKWNNLFKPLPTTGPIDAPGLVKTSTTGKLNCAKSYASMLGSTSTSTPVIDPKSSSSDKLWSSLFKASASDMDKTDGMLKSSSGPSSPISDKHKMDWELSVASSGDEDWHNLQACADDCGARECEKPGESKSSFMYTSTQNESFSFPQKSMVFKRQSVNDVGQDSFSDKQKMDLEVASSSDKDWQNYQACINDWVSGECEKIVESQSSLTYISMQNESMSLPQQSMLFEGQSVNDAGQESEYSDSTASELNLQQLNELKIGQEPLCGESQHSEASLGNDDVKVPDDGAKNLMSLKEDGVRYISQPVLDVNVGSDYRNSSLLEMLTQVKPSDLMLLVAKLIEEVEGLKGSKLEQDLKIMSLEQELVHSRLELHQLKNLHMRLEPGPLPSIRRFEEVIYKSREQCPPETNESVVIVGGYNGSSWLPSLISYFPLHDRVETLSQMTSSRLYASAVKLNGELFVIGGLHGDVWYDTVESYNPLRNQWMQRPSLNEEKGSLAGASLYDKIFAIGGGNGDQCFSEVEMLDLEVGKWIYIRPMMHKRFSPAAADINGALYVVGGYDGKDYLKSVERFDPREDTWTTLGSMNTRRGCHSLVAYNEKLYALGGYDGSSMVSSVEIFDPRYGSWVIGQQMNSPRGYSGAVVIGGKIHVIGGVNDCENILDTIEYYEDGYGWQVYNSRALGKRCFFSATVL